MSETPAQRKRQRSVFPDAAGDRLVAGEAGDRVEPVAGKDAVDVGFSVAVEHVDRAGKEIAVQIDPCFDAAIGGLQPNAVSADKAERGGVVRQRRSMGTVCRRLCSAWA